MTKLAPDIVQAIVNGGHPAPPQLACGAGHMQHWPEPRVVCGNHRKVKGDCETEPIKLHLMGIISLHKTTSFLGYRLQKLGIQAP